MIVISGYNSKGMSSYYTYVCEYVVVNPHYANTYEYCAIGGMVEYRNG